MLRKKEGAFRLFTALLPFHTQQKQPFSPYVHTQFCSLLGTLTSTVLVHNFWFSIFISPNSLLKSLWRFLEQGLLLFFCFFFLPGLFCFQHVFGCVLFPGKSKAGDTDDFSYLGNHGKEFLVEEWGLIIFGHLCTLLAHLVLLEAKFRTYSAKYWTK